jgi:aminotransferase
MNNVTGAMGCAQLKKVDQFISRRKQIFMKYSNELGKLNWLEIPPVLDFENEASYYFFWVQTKYRNELARHLLDNDVYTTFRYWPLHKVDLFSASNLKGDYPNSDYISENTLNLPVHQNLSDNDVQKVIKLISEFQPA